MSNVKAVIYRIEHFGNIDQTPFSYTIVRRTTDDRWESRWCIGNGDDVYQGTYETATQAEDACLDAIEAESQCQCHDMLGKVTRDEVPSEVAQCDSMGGNGGRATATRNANA